MRNRFVSPTVHDCPKSVPVQQQFRDSTHISEVIRRYGMDALPAPAPRQPGVTLDQSMLSDGYHDALLIVQQADAAFNQLPAKIRERFKHNPQLLLQFLNDPKNRDEAVSLGLIDVPDETISLSRETIAELQKPSKAKPKTKDVSDPDPDGEGSAGQNA